MTTVLAGEDSVSPSGMRSGLSVYAGYGRGTFTNMSAVTARFPGKKYISVSPYVTTGVDCLDVEPGDAVPADCPAFVRDWHKVNTNKPVIYANASTMPAVTSALSGAGISRSSYYLWVAEWTGTSAIPGGYDGKQYASTSGYDADSFYDYMWDGGSATVAPAPVWPLKDGSTGPQVAALQALLNTLAPQIGLKTKLAVDSDFGPNTLAAVELAQRHFGYAPPTVLGQISEEYYTGLEHHAQAPASKAPITIPVANEICAPVTDLKLIGEGPHSFKIQWDYAKQGTTPCASFQIATCAGSHLAKDIPSYPRNVKFTKPGTYTGQYGSVNTASSGYIVAVRALAADGHQASEWATVLIPKR